MLRFQSQSQKGILSGLGKNFLLWFLVLSLVPLILVSIISYLAARDNLVQNTNQNLSTSLELKKEYIEAFFFERIGDIELQSRLASNIEFAKNLQGLHQSLNVPVQDLVNHEDWRALEQRSRPDLDRFRKLYGYHDVLFLDVEGNILYSLMAENNLGNNIFTGELADSFFSQGCRLALKTGTTIISDMENLYEHGSSVDIFMIRNLLDKDGQQVGLLALDISLDQIDALLQNRTGLGKTGETFLIGVDQLMRSDSWKENGGKALKTKVNTVPTQNWVAAHQLKEEGKNNIRETPRTESISYVNHSEKEVFGGIKELGALHAYDIHWAVVAEIAKNEALFFMERLRFITMWLVLATILVVGVVSFFLARGIVRPIQKLSELAGQMAEGKKVTMEGRVPENEIGVLMTSFREMAQSFQEITDVCQAIAVGEFHKSLTLRSDRDSLGKSVNQMVDNLQAVVRQAEVISQGDFTVQITPWSQGDQLGTALLRMTNQLRTMETTNKNALDEARKLTDHLNNLPTPVLTVDRNFKIQYINTAGAALAGMTREECLERFCYDLFCNDHCQTNDCRVGMSMRTKNIETAETLVDPAKRSLPIRYTGAPILDEEGEVIGALEYIIDISEAKNALQAIEEENWIQAGVAMVNDRLRGEQEMADLCNNLLSGLADRLDIPMAAMYVAEDDTLHLYGTYSTLENAGHREHFGKGEGLVGQAAKEQKRLIIDNIPQESIRMVSGMLEAAPKQLIALPLIYEEKIMGVLELGSFSPLSEGDLAFLDRVTSHIAITITSTRSRIQLAELLAKTQQQAMELQQQQEELRVTNEELEAQTQSLKERETQLQSQHEELMVVNEELEEKTRSLEQQRADIQAKNRTLETTRRDLEKKAEELAIASKYKSEFLANMSHELRTPLNSLLLLSHNLAENKEGNLSEDQVESAEIMYNSGNDLLELINEILDLAKIEAGRVDLNLDDLPLEELTDRLQGYFQALIAEKGLEFSITMDPRAPISIRTDRQRLEQILRNLVSNAVKFTETGGVTVSLRPLSQEDEKPGSDLGPDSTLIISVTDTGIGIPEDKQKIIFEAFHQVDGSTSRKYGGTGLGLSISRDLAELLGGEIRVTSTAGRGSTFSLYLPFELVADKGSAQFERAGTQKSATQTSPARTVPARRPKPQPDLADDRDSIQPEDKTILIIEDDVNFAKTLVKQSHGKGFKCLTSTSGHNGLMLAEEFSPSAVVLDINLPDMTGWEILDALKKNPTLRHIPVHMISVEEKTLDAYKKGAVGFLHKPVNQKDLHAAFDRLEDVITSEIRDLLIIEDDEILRGQMVKLVGNGNVRIQEVATGSDAMAALKEKKYDCMILDIGLPDMSGFEFLDLLEQEDDIEIPPVIVYTGRELSREENANLYRFTDSIIIKGVKSVERLLDETALFLHRIVDQMPDDSRKMIANLYEQDAMFADKKILIVDDDMRNAFALSKILSAKKMDILIANTGRKALEVLDENESIELVLMDIMMPEMDGYEAIAGIRAQERFLNLPIIALTAKAMPEDKVKCLEAGANDYLAKPIEEARLLSMMRIWLYR